MYQAVAWYRWSAGACLLSVLFAANCAMRMLTCTKIAVFERKYYSSPYNVLVFFFGLLSLSIFFFYFYFFKVVPFCLFHFGQICPYATCFFLWPFVSFNFFLLLLLFLQDCPLCNRIWLFPLSFWTNLSLCNVLFFSLDVINMCL